MTELTVGLIGVGEMGAGLGKAFVEKGYSVISDLTGRSEVSCARASNAGIEAQTTLENVVKRADILMSVLPTQFAYREAERVSRLLKSQQNRIVFVEANAIAPSLTSSIARLFEDENVEFVDAGLVGPPPNASRRPRLYVSGDKLGCLKLLDGSGFDLVELGQTIGTASAFKMTYAAMTKGVNALLTNVMLAAEEHGFLELFLEETKRSQAHLTQRANSNIARLPCDAARWEDEMKQIAKSFDDVGLPSDFHIGACEIMRILADSPFGNETRLTYDQSRNLTTTIQNIALKRASKLN